MVIAGIVLIVVGLLISLTIIGSIFGIPMMMFGLLLCLIGALRRRRTVITNVVHVTNVSAPQAPNPGWAPAGPTALSASTELPQLAPTQERIEPIFSTVSNTGNGVQAPDVKVGDRVSHASFGEGVILSIPDPGAGDVMVAFAQPKKSVSMNLQYLVRTE
jgi:hypothetical protein